MVLGSSSICLSIENFLYSSVPMAVDCTSVQYSRTAMRREPLPDFATPSTRQLRELWRKYPNEESAPFRGLGSPTDFSTVRRGVAFPSGTQ